MIENFSRTPRIRLIMIESKQSFTGHKDPEYPAQRVPVCDDRKRIDEYTERNVRLTIALYGYNSALAVYPAQNTLSGHNALQAQSEEQESKQVISRRIRIESESVNWLDQEKRALSDLLHEKEKLTNQLIDLKKERNTKELLLRDQQLKREVCEGTNVANVQNNRSDNARKSKIQKLKAFFSCIPP